MVGAYVASQMPATGKAFAGYTNLSCAQGVVLGATIIIASTLVGGFKAVTWTGLLQGLFMLFGLLFLPWVAIQAADWVIWIKPHAYDLLEIVPGFIVGLILTISISLMTAAKSPSTTGKHL